MNEINLENEDGLFALPKNMKQIGEAANENKVYIEDYVYTYLHQFAIKNREKEQIAFLVGETKEYEGEDVIFIYGAVAIKEPTKVDGNIELTEENWEYAKRRVQRYFKNYKICGWLYTQPGYGVLLTSYIINEHRKNFDEESSILFIIDSIEKEETIFVYREDELSPVLGFYIFYEKNHMMHEYMLENKVTSYNNQEKKSDKVVKDYRIKVQEKRDDISQKKMLNLLFTVSLALIAICIILGVGLINNVEETNAMKENVNIVMNELNDIKEAISISEVEMIPVDAIDMTELEAGTIIIGEEESTQQNIEDNQEAEEIEEEIVEEAEEVLAENMPEEYTVQEGDNLIKISYRFYNSNNMVEVIQELNNIENPHKIYVGQVILLP